MKEAWNEFLRTGSVKAYLKYIKKQRENSHGKTNNKGDYHQKH